MRPTPSVAPTRSSRALCPRCHRTRHSILGPLSCRSIFLSPYFSIRDFAFSLFSVFRARLSPRACGKPRRRHAFAGIVRVPTIRRSTESSGRRPRRLVRYRILISASMAGGYRFWFSDKYGLIRQRSADGPFGWPEVWSGAAWHRGERDVLDAITGLGEDPWSCGEWADDWTEDQAKDYATRWAVDLYAPAADA